MLVKQFFRYVIVGGLGTVSHLAVLAVCVEVLNWQPVVASIAGFISALLVSYNLNYHWAFQSRRSHMEGVWRYIVVSLGGLLLNAGMMSALIKYAHVNYFLSQLYVVAVVPVCNFIINRYWTFGVGKRGR
ncbi:GtrA family protein [Pseudomonas sp. C9-3]|uniref:GtrA family protein n=1 Tax=Pseudomonas sp. C9-3 TaxID=3078264 RepID=UPI003964808E